MTQRPPTLPHGHPLGKNLSEPEPEPARFERLPQELKWIIWEMLIPDPCVIILVYDSHTGGVFSCRKPPIAFQICQSSRYFMQVKSNYCLAFSTNRHRAQIYVDFDRDTILFDPVGDMANIISQLPNSSTHNWRVANKEWRVDVNADDLARIKRMAIFPEYSSRPYETIRINFPALELLSIIVDGLFSYRRETLIVNTGESTSVRNNMLWNPAMKIITRFMEIGLRRVSSRLQWEKAAGNFSQDFTLHVAAIASRGKGDKFFTRSFKDNVTGRWLPARIYHNKDDTCGFPLIPDTQRQMQACLPLGWWNLQRWI